MQKVDQNINQKSWKIASQITKIYQAIGLCNNDFIRDLLNFLELG